MDINHKNLEGGTLITPTGFAATQEARPTMGTVWMEIDYKNLEGGTHSTPAGFAGTQEAGPTSDRNGAGGDPRCGDDLGDFLFGCNLLGGGGCPKTWQGGIRDLEGEACLRDRANPDGDLRKAESFNAGYL